MKNYRKILILLGLLAIVATFTVSPTFAATKTVNLNKWLCYYPTDSGNKYEANYAYTACYKDFKVGSTKFMVHASATINFGKGNKNFLFSDMGVVCNKKFKSATFYKINVKTLKVTKKTMKAHLLPKDLRDKNAQYGVADPVGKSDYVPYKIVINY